MNTTGTTGVFHGRLTSLALRFTAKCFPVCLGPRRRALNGSTSDDTTSHAVSIRRGAYLSPYDRAVYMIERLLRLPSMATFLYPILIDENIGNTGQYKDPTVPLKTLFDHGYTLNILLNELESPFVRTINLYERVDEPGYQHHQAELFWRGCVDAGLTLPEVLPRLDDEGWVGGSAALDLALVTVMGILDILQERGRLGSPDPRYIKPRSIYPAARAAPGAPRHVVLAAELAQTEVAYMQDLEQLALFAKRVRAQVDCDTSDVDTAMIFGHLDGLLALHTTFSMRIQYLAGMPPDQQFFDSVYGGLEFDVYSSFCASRDLAQRAYAAALPVLKQINCGGLDPVFDVTSLFMRPVQRLAQYPILFQSIVDALCDSCASLSLEDKAKRVLVIKSMYRAMRHSKRILSRANEATREATNQANSASFFDRIDASLTSDLSEESVGRLMTSGKVSVRSTRDYEELEAFLFAGSLVLCKPVDPVQSSRSAKFRRTLSTLHMTIRTSTRLEDRRRSESSVSSSTLHTRSPTPDDCAECPAREFQLPTIARDSPPLISPPTKLLSSYASLVSLRDKPSPIIRFTSSVDVTIADECQSKARLSRLCPREQYPTGAISQISQAHEINGTVRLTIQVMMASGSEKILVFRRLTQETAAVWVRMLKHAVPLVPVDDENAAQNAYHCLHVNPRFSKSVLGRSIPV
ncbi:Guanine nucleotide exchange factor for Cdc42p [Coemansia furcata]|uniref:Guanine nucleotide exchange factor for Cdc42p n=1 Tax=Coemansia furcata TaxID=417177 RepID=A0ACC1LQ42_9FUNG|nr:Guanine nucleotide exchange factor for Cdc42p [Coemansia furcata]